MQSPAIVAATEKVLLPLLKLFHRRSVTLAAVALALSLLALGYLPEFHHQLHQKGWPFLCDATLVCIGTFSVSTAVLLNLIRDVNRGYSSERCSLTAFILFFAFVPAIVLAYALMTQRERDMRYRSPRSR
jgi:hypothetical protein